MALTAGRQSWTNNGAYGSYMKSVMHHQDDGWDNEGPELWYRSENAAYGSFDSSQMNSFKDIASYRNNVRTTWSFKVAPTTYDELGSFYKGIQEADQHRPPAKLAPLAHRNTNNSDGYGYSIDAAIQSDSADIHYSNDGKVSRSAQINEEELMPQSNEKEKSERRKAPASLPPIKKRPVQIATSPLPEIEPHHNFDADTDENRPNTPIRGILKKLSDREHHESAWHRYIEDKPHLIEDMRKKGVKGTRAPSRERLYVPSVHPSSEANNETTGSHHHSQPRRPAENDDSHLRSHFYATSGETQPAMERLFVSDDYGGESKWVSPDDYNSTANKRHQIVAATSHVPLYLETPWPMNMTMPIQTKPDIGILPREGHNNELQLRTSFGRGGKGRRGIRILYDHRGNGTMYVA